MESQDIAVSLRFERGIAILEVSGEIDLFTAPRFQSAVSTAIDEGYVRLLIDLSRVTFMDSKGYGALLTAARKVKPVGGRIGLIGCNALVTRLVRLTRLDAVMELYDDLDRALTGLAPDG